MEGYIGKGNSSLTPNHASCRVLVTRQDGNQGFAQGTYSDPTGSLDIDALLAQLATGSGIPPALLQRGQSGEPLIDAAIAQASTMLQPLPQRKREPAAEATQGDQATASQAPLKDWAAMTEQERREEAAAYFKQEFSWEAVAENLAIAFTIIGVLASLPEGAIGAVVLAGILVQLAIAYGIFTIIAPYFEGEAPGWLEWVKGGLLAIGGIAGGIALGIASPEIAAFAGTAAIVAGIAYAVVEAISAYIQFEEGIASDTRDGMQESVRNSAREAEHALPDAIVAALAAKDLKKLLTRIRPLTPEAPAEAAPELASSSEEATSTTAEHPALEPVETSESAGSNTGEEPVAAEAASAEATSSNDLATEELVTETGEVIQIRYWKPAREILGRKVYQRDDLFDPHAVDKTGRTNIQRMQQGLAPMGYDNKQVQLHHLIQVEPGAMAEVQATFHSSHTRTLHWLEDNQSFRTHDGRRSEWPTTAGGNLQKTPKEKGFEKWRGEYWQFRAKELLTSQ